MKNDTINSSITDQTTQNRQHRMKSLGADSFEETDVYNAKLLTIVIATVTRYLRLLK